MKEYKLNVDRKMPTDAEIDKHKDFASLLAQMPEAAPPTASTPSILRRYWGYFGAAALILIGIGLWYPLSKDDAPSSNAVTDTKISMPNTNGVTTAVPIPIESHKEVASSPNVKEEPLKKEVLPPAAEKPTEKKVEKKDEVVVSTPTPVETPSTPQLVEPKRSSGKTLAFKTDVSRFPELSVYEGVQWEYVGTTDEENPYKNGVLNVKNTWKSVEIEKKDASTYLLILKDKEGKTFSFPARPVFKDKDYDEAMRIYQERKPKAALDTKTWE